MASTAPFAVTALIVVLFNTVFGDPHHFFLQQPSHVHGHRHSMILPLFLSSSPNLSVNSVGRYRRHLQGSASVGISNARMPLYDDLFHTGYYSTKIWIGTPPQKFALIDDTGSTVTYVPCSTCESCGMHQDPKFQPDKSTTYKPAKCEVDCPCDNEKAQCTYEIIYAESSTSSGVIGNDKICFGNESELMPQRVNFGCENEETGDLYSQIADGIVGLGHGDLSIVDQLVKKGVINNSFSLCYGGMDVEGGAMVLGEISPPSDMVFTRSDSNRSPYYNVELKAIQVAGKQLALNTSVFEGKYGTILDSGTTFSYLPKDAFIAFKDAIMKELSSLEQIAGPDPQYVDICFSGAGSDLSQLTKVFPTVDMIYDNGQKLSLDPENYLFRHSKKNGAYCLGIFQNGMETTTLLGGIIGRNTLVMYDREHERIGFWKTNCSQIWKRLQDSAQSMHTSPNLTANPPLPSSPILTANSPLPSGPILTANSVRNSSTSTAHNSPVHSFQGSISFVLLQLLMASLFSLSL